MLFLSTGETDAVAVCGGEAVTLYNLVTGEERCTVGLAKCPQGMTTVLVENTTCVALSYKWVSAEYPELLLWSFYRHKRSCGKVFTPVCHSVHGGGSAFPQYNGADRPPL